MVILAFLVVYLITSQVGLNDRYLSLYYTHVNVYNNCVERPCLVKCCGSGQVLEENGVCVVGNKYENDYNISIYTWDKIGKVVNQTKRKVYDDMMLIQNQELYPVCSGDIWILNDFYVLQDGSLKVVLSTGQWIDIRSLDFCLDYFITSVDGEKTVAFAIKTPKEGLKENEALFKLSLFGAGMVLTLLVMICIVLNISPSMRHTLSPTLTAFSVTIMIPYTLKIAQLCNVIFGNTYFGDCRLISPALYFFILSSFFWSNIFFYDLNWRLLRFRKNGGNLHQKENNLRFICYCIFACGIPFLMTMAAVALDTFDLNKIMPEYYVQQMVKPPLETCFTNEKQANLYVYVPIAILTLSECILFIKACLNICAIRDTGIIFPYIKNKPIAVITSKIRMKVFLKLVTLIAILYILKVVIYMPTLLYYIITFYTICICVTIFYIFVVKDLKKTTFENIDAAEFLKKLTAKLKNHTLTKTDQENAKMLPSDNT